MTNTSVILTLVRFAFWITIFVVAGLALLPDAEPVVTTGWDKTNHIFAFCVLMALLDIGWPALALWGDKVRILMGYGLLLECMQSITPQRLFSIWDLLADFIGILIYIGGVWCYRKYLSQTRS